MILVIWLESSQWNRSYDPNWEWVMLDVTQVARKPECCKSWPRSTWGYNITKIISLVANEGGSPIFLLLHLQWKWIAWVVQPHQAGDVYSRSTTSPCPEKKIRSPGQVFSQPQYLTLLQWIQCGTGTGSKGSISKNASNCMVQCLRWQDVGHWCRDFWAKETNAFIAFGGTVGIRSSRAVGCDQMLQE